MKLLVTVGIQMDYGRYIPIEARSVRQALSRAQPYCDEKKHESCFEVRWDIPEWFKDALADPCNQVIWDPYLGTKDGFTDWYDRNRPLRAPAMVKLEKELNRLHKAQVEKWGAKALSIVLKEFAKRNLDPSDQFTADHCCGDNWLDLVAACHYNGHGVRYNICFDLIRKVAAPISELLNRAYYGKALYGMWKNRKIVVTV
jgi:hypothetical protein